MFGSIRIGEESIKCQYSEDCPYKKFQSDFGTKRDSFPNLKPPNKDIKIEEDSYNCTNFRIWGFCSLTH